MCFGNTTDRIYRDQENPGGSAVRQQQDFEDQYFGFKQQSLAPKTIYEHSLKCLSQGHSILNLLQNRVLVLGCLSPKTASSLLDPHCLLSCCFSCDTLSFTLCTSTYNFEALIRQKKNNNKKKIRKQL